MASDSSFQWGYLFLAGKEWFADCEFSATFPGVENWFWQPLMMLMMLLLGVERYPLYVASFVLHMDTDGREHW